MPEITASRYLTQAGWDDVPHLSATTKRDLFDSTPPYLRDARAYGKPSLGAGAIYPVPESEILVDPFQIPAHWKKAYGMDVGWNRTAAVWGAIEPETGIVYLYAEHYKGQAEPVIHAQAIRARGDWIPGAIDPAAEGRGQIDGAQLFQNYADLGLNLTKADNAVEAGLHQCWTLLSVGRVKVFRTLQNFMVEYRLYRRDENGKIVKKDDHLMDAFRYLVMTGLGIACVRPVAQIGTPHRVLDPRAGY